MTKINLLIVLPSSQPLEPHSFLNAVYRRALVSSAGEKTDINFSHFEGWQGQGQGAGIRGVCAACFLACGRRLLRVSHVWRADEEVIIVCFIPS